MINDSRIINHKQVIWRYMDLWKFEKLLEDNGNLYCTRADKFEDSLEGKYSNITISSLEKLYKEKHGKVFVKNWKALYFDDADYVEATKRNSLVNCWHKNDTEDLDMWESYTKSQDSLVIKTNIENLIESIDILDNSSFCIDIGEVKYVDFHNIPLHYENNILAPLFYKDKEYLFENELRIIVWRRPENNILRTLNSNFNVKHGGSIRINLNKLISKIYISPFADDGFTVKIANILEKNNLKKPIFKSTIKEVKD